MTGQPATDAVVDLLILAVIFLGLLAGFTLLYMGAGI